MNRKNHPKRGTVMVRVSQRTRQMIRDVRAALISDLERDVKTPEILERAVTDYAERVQRDLSEDIPSLNQK